MNVQTIACLIGSTLLGFGCSKGRGGDDPKLLFQEDFESLDLGEGWVEGKAYGNWKVIYLSGGSQGIEVDGSRVYTQQPAAATQPDQTLAPLTHTILSFSGDIEVSVRMKTVTQLRTSSPPNNWETAWLSWHADTKLHRNYYFTLKNVGWELGKGFGLPPNNQEFLATGSAPSVTLGTWQTVKIRQVDNVITVWVDGEELATVADDQSAWPVYTSGEIGLYSEDAHSHFDDVVVRRP
jgi:hypothetical protein